LDKKEKKTKEELRTDRCKTTEQRPEKGEEMFADRWSGVGHKREKVRTRLFGTRSIPASVERVVKKGKPAAKKRGRALRDQQRNRTISQRLQLNLPTSKRSKGGQGRGRRSINGDSMKKERVRNLGAAFHHPVVVTSWPIKGKEETVPEPRCSRQSREIIKGKEERCWGKKNHL